MERPRIEDLIPDGPQKRTFMQFLDLFVRPEIERRRASGEIGENFVVTRAQAILYPDMRPWTVRLNDEISGEAVARLGPGSEGRTYFAESTVYEHEIDGFERFALPPEEADNGHITMIAFGGTKFALFFDARRSRGRAKVLVERARQFFELAEIAYDRQSWTALVDILFSAAELAVRAAMWTGPLGFDFAERMRHGAIGDTFSKFVGWGNANPRLLKTYNDLTRFRPLLRYRGEKERVRPAVGRRWLEDVRAMIEMAEAAVRSTMDDAQEMLVTAPERAPEASGGSEG